MLPRTTAAFTSAGEPHGFAALSQLTSLRRPSMRFLFIRLQVVLLASVVTSLLGTHSLPSHPTSRLRSWLLVIVLSFYLLVLTIVDFNHIYIVPMLGTHKTLVSIPLRRSATPLHDTAPRSKKELHEPKVALKYHK